MGNLTLKGVIFSGAMMIVREIQINSTFNGLFFTLSLYTLLKLCFLRALVSGVQGTTLPATNKELELVLIRHFYYYKNDFSAFWHICCRF